MNNYKNSMEEQGGHHNHAQRDMLIILIIALLLALLIWRYFEYKITKLKTGYGYHFECPLQETANNFQFHLSTEYSIPENIKPD